MKKYPKHFEEWVWRLLTCPSHEREQLIEQADIKIHKVMERMSVNEFHAYQINLIQKRFIQ